MAGLYPDCIAAYLIRQRGRRQNTAQRIERLSASYGTMKDGPFSHSAGMFIRELNGSPHLPAHPLQKAEQRLPLNLVVRRKRGHPQPEAGGDVFRQVLGRAASRLAHASHEATSAAQ